MLHRVLTFTLRSDRDFIRRAQCLMILINLDGDKENHTVESARNLVISSYHDHNHKCCVNCNVIFLKTESELMKLIGMAVSKSFNDFMSDFNNYFRIYFVHKVKTAVIFVWIFSQGAYV